MRKKTTHVLAIARKAQQLVTQLYTRATTSSAPHPNEDDEWLFESWPEALAPLSESRQKRIQNVKPIAAMYYSADLVLDHGGIEPVLIKSAGLRLRPGQLSLKEEAQLLCKLSPHPNVVGYRGIERIELDDPAPRLVFEGGVLLQEILHAHEAMPSQLVAYIILSLLNGLSHVHSIGIVHNDVKPIHVVLSRHGEVKLAGFDNARKARQRYGHLRGTLTYMSPEALCHGPLDARSDLWSVGVLMHTLLTGKHPWEDALKRTNWQSALERQILEAPLPGMPLKLEASELYPIIERLLAKDPCKRFADTATAIEALEARAPNAYSLRTRNELARVVRTAEHAPRINTVGDRHLN
jgi:serine/threonine protein kinase